MKLLNSFSLNMLDLTKAQQVRFTPLTTEQAGDLLGREGGSILTGRKLESCVGHPDTAGLIGVVLDRPVTFNRVTVRLEDEEMAVVAQYIGPRLPEGVTELPEGAQLEFVLISVGSRTPYLFMEGFYDDQGMPWDKWSVTWALTE